MTHKFAYEWDIETVDEHGDILDHDHSATCPAHELAHNERLVLVRDVIGPEGVDDRTWAYVTGGKLPTFFSDAWQTHTREVPKKFHNELKKALEK